MTNSDWKVCLKALQEMRSRVVEEEPPGPRDRDGYAREYRMWHGEVAMIDNVISKVEDNIT